MGGIGSGRRVRRNCEKVEQVVWLYSGGVLLKDIAAKVNMDYHTVVKILKDAGTYDPTRSKTAGIKCLCEANQQRHEASRQISNNLVSKIEARGFTYLSGYNGKDSKVKVCCITCGTISDRSLVGFRKNTAICLNCRKIEAEERKAKAEAKEKREREEKKKQREALRALINPLGLSAYQLEKERKLDEVHTCKVCGSQYTVRQYMESCGLSFYSDAGYCSKTCKYLRTRSKANESRKKHPRENKNHYDRARKLGLPRDRGITLRKLIERDGLYCAICGMACIYSGDSKSDLYPSIDHIIPMKKGGGHTWDNVQVAHRICNSIKGAKIGEEYGNVKKENN